MRILLLTALGFFAASGLAGYGQNATTNSSSSVESLQREVQEMHDLITWGAPATNGSGIQIGIFMFLGVSSEARISGSGAYLYSTNHWLGYFPPGGYRLSLSLKEANGNEVKKTAQGEAISKPGARLTKQEILQHRVRPIVPDTLAGIVPKLYESFNLLDCFKVERPGTNTLTVGGTVYKQRAGVFTGVTLPPVSVQVPIAQADLDRYRASKAKPQ